MLLVLMLVCVECSNILHIIVDDLRPEVGAYGIAGHYTPNIDALASEGVTFDRAYCQIAVCGPSRNSFLSGRRPDSSRSWNFINSFREDHPDWTSLPGFFKKAGWNALGTGKTYHPFVPPDWDGTKSWSERALPYTNPCWLYGLSCVPCEGVNGTKVEKICSDGGFGPGAVETCWCEVEALEDVLTVDHALSLLDTAVREFNHERKGFYLAVGLHKPHLPWQAAKKHFDRFPLDQISIATHNTAPIGMPGIAFASCDSHDPWTPISDVGARHARRAYYAATAGMDEQVGRLLDALRDHGVDKDTTIILHGDHGWQLGEHGEWRKNTVWELGTRVPLIIRPPPGWLPSGRQGGRARGLAELVDLYPTFAELAGIDPAHILHPGETPLAGRSLVPLLHNISAHVKDASLSQYPRRVRNKAQPWSGNGIDHVDRTNFTAMGYSLRDLEWRYTEWRAWNATSLAADWSDTGIIGRELYDHRGETIYPTNFNEGENVNLLGNTTTIPPLWSNTTAALSIRLRHHFNPALPVSIP